MTMFGKKHTEETKAKISFAKRGRRLSVAHRAKISLGLFGKHPSPETRLRLSLAKRGHAVSQQTKEKISFSKRGQEPWNKGRHLTEEHRKRVGASLKAHGFSLERRKQIAEQMRGFVISETHRAALARGNRFGRKLEQAVADSFTRLGIPFERERRIPGINKFFDFLLPGRKLAVEVDGCYWHACSDCFPSSDRTAVWQKDAEVDRQALAADWRVVRIPEHVIRAMETC